MTVKNSGPGTVRLISLNVAGGMLLDKLEQFIMEERGRTDVFCFQEVVARKPRFPGRIKFDERTYEVLKSALNGFSCHSTTPYTVNDQFLTMFLRDGIKMARAGSVVLVKPRSKGVRSWAKMQYAEMLVGGGRAVVAHLHGLFVPHEDQRLHYSDTPERMRQSRNVIAALDRLRRPAVLCGDFNLKGNTRSIAMIEGRMLNITKERGIRTTRNSFALPGSYRLTDYAFASPGVVVSEFSVISENVSDHLPLRLAFSLT